MIMSNKLLFKHLEYLSKQTEQAKTKKDIEIIAQVY